jgi:hypothetical protein
MISHPPMRRIPGFLACLAVSSVVLLATSCGEGPGGRCQVNDDCESGLICCQVNQGNGQCGSSCLVGGGDAGAYTVDGAADAAADDLADEVAIDVAPSTPGGSASSTVDALAIGASYVPATVADAGEAEAAVFGP